MVIENKIYHHEGNRQIARYGEYLDSLPHQDSLKQLFYLTLDGCEATSQEGHSYLRISYRTHILAWLELCLQSTYDIPPINQVIIQYKAVVQQLTGTHLESRSMNKIKDFLRAKPEILAQLPQIQTAINELYRESTFQFFDHLITQLKDDYHAEYRSGMLPREQEENPSLILRPKQDDFTEGHQYEIWVEQNRHDNIICGIEAAWKKEGSSPAEQERLEAARSYIESTHPWPDYSDVGYTKSWRWTHWPLGVHVVGPMMTNGRTDFSVFFDESAKKKFLEDCHQQINHTVDILRTAFRTVP